MNQGIEYLKRLNMVGILNDHYHTQFTRNGNEYVCRSPFTEESKPSFFVKQGDDGHWLFKDFSSGFGGSIIDFVLLKEKLNSGSEAVKHLQGLLNQNAAGKIAERRAPKTTTAAKAYDIHYIYDQLKNNDVAVSRDYLLNRGIMSSLVDQLINEHILLCNRHKDISYCTFAVYDQDNQLRCFDNHMINGTGKFVLGKKHIFSRDWPQLQTSRTVYICESIIDYLSIKTLEGVSSIGIALLGNQLNGYDLSFLNKTSTLVSCFDNDGGGFSGYLDLQERYPEKEITIYELSATQKDVNDRLLSEQRSQRVESLTAHDKLAIYQAFIGSDNRRQLAKDWGIDRSYLYKIVKECEENILSNFQEKRPGRKPSHNVENKSAARKQIAQLEAEKKQLAKEKEFYHAKSEFLNLRLKWSEREVSELKGDNDDSGDAKKAQLKKKKKKKR
jgi:DNA primase